MPEFQKHVTMRVLNDFSVKSDIRDVLAFVLEQKIPGELVVSIPGNGGITSVRFLEKERKMEAETPTQK